MACAVFFFTRRTRSTLCFFRTFLYVVDLYTALFL